MGERKRRRVATVETAKSHVDNETTARWAELPREIVAIIASFACVPLLPLPFTCLAHTADPDSLAYHRQEDRSSFGLGSQFIAGQCHSPHAPGPMGHMGRDGDRPSVAGAPGSADPSSSPGGDGLEGTLYGPDGSGAIPGTFRPCRISETAIAMRCVCRSWCEVLSEGVRRVMLAGREIYTIWATHFPEISHLALGNCSDLLVWSPDRPAVQSSRRRSAVRSNETGPTGPSSTAVAAVVADCNSGSRRRSTRSTAARSVAATSATVSTAAARSSRRSSTSGGAAPPLSRRSLAALSSLRNLQVTDSSIHLDLAATCPLLEELVVWTRHQHEYGTHAGRDTYGVLGPLNNCMPGRGVAGRRDGPMTRRSALDRILSSLPRLRRLRLSGIDASAARLGLALMELTALTSLRLLQCRLPTFFGSAASERPRSANSNHNKFGRELILNLGAKLQDLSLQGCCIRALPEEVLAGLTGLRMLDLSSNWLHTLPASVTLLQRLEYLDVQHNAISSLPQGLAAMSRLADLDLSGNYIHRLPADFGQLTTMTHLHLGGLHGLDIQTCLPLLTSLTNLHSLGLSDVDLSVDEIELNGGGGDDGGIQQTRVTQGPLHELVSALGPAGRLRELMLDGCGLETLPACFSMLTSLSHLSLMENFDASGLPDTITCLGGLEVLRLGYLDLAVRLPDGLFDMSALRELDLEQNCLPCVSPEISKLSNLQILNLIDSLDPDAPHNAIPWASIYNLSKLRSLMVSGQDKGHQVPRGIGALTALEALQLRCVELTPAVMEAVCTSLLNLQSMDVADCGITALPGSITRLRRLTELDLSDNKVTRLPPTFGGLTRLTELALRGNLYVRSLPVDMTRLTRLRSFSWTVHRSHTTSPSSALLSWLAKIPELALIGEHNFGELAKSHGIPWRQCNPHLR